MEFNRRPLLRILFTLAFESVLKARADARNGRFSIFLRLHFTRMNRETQTQAQTQDKKNKQTNTQVHSRPPSWKEDLNCACVSYFPCVCVKRVNLVCVCICVNTRNPRLRGSRATFLGNIKAFAFVSRLLRQHVLNMSKKEILSVVPSKMKTRV